MTVVKFAPWEVHQFPWGSAVKKRNGSWTRVFIGGQELNVDNIKVILHDNGIEFLA